MPSLSDASWEQVKAKVDSCRRWFLVFNFLSVSFICFPLCVRLCKINYILAGKLKTESSAIMNLSLERYYPSVRWRLTNLNEHHNIYFHMAYNGLIQKNKLDARIVNTVVMENFKKGNIYMWKRRDERDKVCSFTFKLFACVPFKASHRRSNCGLKRASTQSRYGLIRQRNLQVGEVTPTSRCSGCWWSFPPPEMCRDWQQAGGWMVTHHYHLSFWPVNQDFYSLVVTLSFSIWLPTSVACIRCASSVLSSLNGTFLSEELDICCTLRRWSTFNSCW